MLGYGAFPTTSSWWSTGTPLLRPVIAFGDLTNVEGVSQSEWFFGPVVYEDAGLGAYPLSSAWTGVTSGYFARQVLNFSDLDDVEGSTQSLWFFGEYVPVAPTLDLEVGSYSITGEAAELVRTGILPTDNYISEATSGVSTLSNTMESFFTMAENASAADTITNAKVIDVAMSEGATAEDTPGRTWNPINTPQTTTWTLIQTP